jgi:hypothetical protein
LESFHTLNYQPFKRKGVEHGHEACASEDNGQESGEIRRGASSGWNASMGYQGRTAVLPVWLHKQILSGESRGRAASAVESHEQGGTKGGCKFRDQLHLLARINNLNAFPGEYKSAGVSQFSKEESNMRVEDLVLFCRNTGDYYRAYCNMARRNDDISEWSRHLKDWAIPRYRRECREPDASISSRDRVKAATELRAYYRQHINEV